MDFQPLHDRILLRRIEQKEKTAGGLLIPETAKDKPIEGEVLAVGAGALTSDGKVIPMQLKKGDRVLFSDARGSLTAPAAIHEINVNGQDYVVIKESDVLGIVKAA